MYYKHVENGYTYVLRDGDAFVVLPLLWIDIDIEPQDKWGIYDEIKDPDSGETWPLHRRHLDKLKPGFQIVKNTMFPLVVGNGTMLGETEEVYYYDDTGIVVPAGSTENFRIVQVGETRYYYANINVSDSSGVDVYFSHINGQFFYGPFNNVTSSGKRNSQFINSYGQILGFSNVFTIENNDATNNATVNFRHLVITRKRNIIAV